jgi:hypothetical protein
MSGRLDVKGYSRRLGWDMVCKTSVGATRKGNGSSGTPWLLATGRMSEQTDTLESGPDQQHIGIPEKLRT